MQVIGEYSRSVCGGDIKFAAVVLCSEKQKSSQVHLVRFSVVLQTGYLDQSSNLFTHII